jgi:two-component system response regulator PhoP
VLLVVEDDPLALRAILRLVGDRAAQVATSAAEARAAVPTSRAWSGLLVDAGLPEGPMAGIDIVREIRGTGPLIPSAIVTGRLERAVVQAGADLNAMVILKPDVHAGVAHFLARVDAAQMAQIVRPRSQTLGNGTGLRRARQRSWPGS